MKVLIPDTNLLLHGKFIDEIKWNSIFDEENIVVVITYTVLKELDHAKYTKNRARQLISFFKKYETDENLNKKIPLKISPKKVNWESLPQKYKNILDKEDSDHNILAEIIKDYNNNLSDVYIVSADYTFLKIATELGINCMDWLETDKENLFGTLDLINEKKPKHPKLGLYFDKDMTTELMFTKILNKVEILSYNDLVKPNVQYDIKWQLENPSVIKKKIKVYNEQIKLINSHHKIDLYLINRSNHPYNDVDIYIRTILEKSFVFTINELIKTPRKPFLPRLNVRYVNGIPINPKESIYLSEGEKIARLMNLDMEIFSEVKGNMISWEIKYHIDKIKHNTIIHLIPLLLFIPNIFDISHINLRINFTQEEPGSIKEQKLNIKLLQN